GQCAGSLQAAYHAVAGYPSVQHSADLPASARGGLPRWRDFVPDYVRRDRVVELVRLYSAQLGFEIGAHALRATAATNALDHEADIAKVQEWLGYANIATRRIYDHRKTRPEDSPTFKVSY